MTLTTHHLRFTATVTAPLELDQQSGAAIRGALTSALWERFCTNKAAPTCAACPLVRVCPVATLVAPLREDDQPGGDQRPRPYVIRPPLIGAHAYAPGESLSFELGLIGSAAQLFPYVVMAAQGLAQSGLGKRVAVNNHRRGTIAVTAIDAIHPLSGAAQTLYRADQPIVQMPGLPVTAEEVATWAGRLPTDHMTLQLNTPLRLTDDGQLVRRLTLRPLIQRLMRRLDDLSRSYGAGPLAIDFRALLDQANTIHVIDDRTRWVDLASYSSRQRKLTPIGGLVGAITFAGDLAALRELLVWGSLIHVGKNAVKGDGWYTIIT